MNSQQHIRQFLLTQNPTAKLIGWEKLSIGKYILYAHPKLKISHLKSHNVEFVLIGYFFDYEKPNATNMDILGDLSKDSFDIYLRRLDKYTGQFVLIRKDESSFTLINDAGAQREVYYTSGFETFASQPKLIQLIEEALPSKNNSANSFYNSITFNKKRIYIADTTQWENIKHLKPNHYIDLNAGNVIRFFPYKNREERPLNIAVEESTKRISGFLAAVAQRHPKVAIPVTAGYDSRLLFAASHNIDCRYYIFKHRKLNDQHYDISIPKKLFEKYPYNFEEIIYNEDTNNEIIQQHSQSIDYPRPTNTTLIFNGFSKNFSDYIILDTIMSELARNRYGNFKNLNAKDLAYLNNYKNERFVISEYQKWLEESRKTILDNNYNIPDLFYWEEIMGNWAAKSKTEYELATEFFSLLNSRELIDLMMSTNIKYRQPNNNILYNTIIKKLSPEALTLPVNPSQRTSVQKFMQKMRIFDAYRYIKIKLKI